MDSNRFIITLASLLESSGVDRETAMRRARSFLSSVPEDKRDGVVALSDDSAAMRRIASTIISHPDPRQRQESSRPQKPTQEQAPSQPQAQQARRLNEESASNGYDDDDDDGDDEIINAMLNTPPQKPRQTFPANGGQPRQSQPPQQQQQRPGEPVRDRQTPPPQRNAPAAPSPQRRTPPPQQQGAARQQAMSSQSAPSQAAPSRRPAQPYPQQRPRTAAPAQPKSGSSQSGIFAGLKSLFSSGGKAQGSGREGGERRVIYKPDPNADYSKFYIILACSSPLWGFIALCGIAAFVTAIGFFSAAIVALIVLLFVGVAVGVVLALVGIIYGITQLFELPPVGMYEIGLGIRIGGIVMFGGILAYNIAVRFLPFIIKETMVLLSFTIHKCIELYYYVKGRCADL